MNSKPLVSVIVPVYNVEAYIAECVDSIVAQTYKNIEIVLIDDGSTDSSGEICDTYSRKYDNIISCHQKNKKSAAARNHGIRISKGDYIAFVDSDDVIMPEFIATLIKLLQDGRYELAVVDIIFVDNNLKKKEVKKLETDFLSLEPRQLAMDMIQMNMVSSVVNKMYVRRIIEDNRICFQEGQIFWEDMSFNIDYIRYIKSRIAYMPDGLYYARYKSDSLTHDANYLYNGFWTRSSKQVYDLAKQCPDFGEEFLKNAAGLYVRYIIKQFYVGGILGTHYNKIIMKKTQNELRNIDFLPIDTADKIKLDLMLKHPVVAFFISRLNYLRKKINRTL